MKKSVLLMVVIAAAMLTAVAYAAGAGSWWILNNTDCVDTGLANAGNLAPESIEKAYKCRRVYREGDASRSVMTLICVVDGTEKSLLYARSRYLCLELKKAANKAEERDDIPTRSDSY